MIDGGTIDPLGPENVLFVLTGPLIGFYTGARICISGKSPLTNGIAGSTVAGEFPVELKCAGYDGVIITGRATRSSYLFITDSKAEIKDASHLWGKTVQSLSYRGCSRIRQALRVGCDFFTHDVKHLVNPGNG